MKNEKCFQIKPRHLFFNVLARYDGKIKRQELYESIYKTGSALSEKGYNLTFSCSLKGSKDAGYWNGYIDSELLLWMIAGILDKEGDYYVFIPKEEQPFDSLTNILKRINGSLDKEILNALEDSIKR